MILSDLTVKMNYFWLKFNLFVCRMLFLKINLVWKYRGGMDLLHTIQ